MVSDVGGPRQQAVLATLLLRPNAVVTADQLCEAVWSRLPASPATNLRTYVSGLRRRLRQVEGADDRLSTRPGGYSLSVRPGEVDAQVFQELLGTGAEALRAGAPEAALADLDRALALWRAESVGDFADSPVLRAEFDRLADLRLRALEHRCAALVELGRQDVAAVELGRLVVEHPLREGLWTLLMTALLRGGRRAEALDAFARARRHLVGELGIEPGPQLQRLRQEVLAEGPDAPSAPAPGIADGPRQLPMDITEFTGREAELRQVFESTAHLGWTSAGEPTAVPVVVLTGMAGVGKTRLAVHAAHRLVRARRFDEVQLWADLRGSDTRLPPADPTAVLEGFLRALGAPVPRDSRLWPALYRDRLAGRRALVVLDDAVDVEQVVPLLPGDASCLVLVTGRRTLVGLAGARHVELDVFSAEEATDLLAGIAGRERVTAAPAATRRLIALCDRLPAVIAIAARRLHTRPGWSVGDLVAHVENSDDPARWGATSLEASRRSLDPAQQRLFRLLGAHLLDDADVPAAAALADLPAETAAALLGDLLDSHLLYQEVPGRYRMRGLVRGHARTHDREDPVTPFTRLLEHYLRGTERAVSLLHPDEPHRVRGDDHADDEPHPDPVDWLVAEHANLAGAAHRGLGLPDPVAARAVRLVVALHRPLTGLGAPAERIALGRLASRVAQRTGDLPTAARLLADLAAVLTDSGRHTEAAEQARRALDLARRAGDPVTEADCLVALGTADRRWGRSRPAAEALRRALEVAGRAGYRSGEAAALVGLSLVGLDLVGPGPVERAPDEVGRAIGNAWRGAELYREVGSRRGVGSALAALGRLHLRSGRADDAVAHHEQALAAFRAVADRYGEARQLWALGNAHRAADHPRQAREHWDRALAVLRELGALGRAEAEHLTRQEVPDTPRLLLLAP